ncbi:MAG: hypothetical protein SFY68_15870 [Candidatus Sumerlaeia bacterium]|nr:hypothetical protein [Candidatus Sumerlaeia bacterium]
MKKTILTTGLMASLLSFAAAQDGVYNLTGGVVTFGQPLDNPPVVQTPTVLRTMPNLVPPPATIYVRVPGFSVDYPLVIDDNTTTPAVTVRITDSASIQHDFPGAPPQGPFVIPTPNSIANGPFTAQIIANDGFNAPVVSSPANGFLDTEFATALGSNFSTASPLIASNTTPTLTGTFNINPGNLIHFAPLNNVEVQVTRPNPFFTTSLSAAAGSPNITGNNWSVSLNTNALPGEGVYNINLRVIDLANNPVNPSGPNTSGVRSGSINANPQSLIVDFTQATTVLAANTVSNGGNIVAPETFTVTFTDATTVSGFAAGDVQIVGTGNGTVTNVQSLGNNTFSFLFTPTVNGAFSIQIPAEAGEDQAFNKSQASNTLNFIAGAGDTTAPTITGPVVIQRTLPGGNPPPTFVRNQQPRITWTSLSDDVAVTSGTLIITDSLNNVFSFAINPSLNEFTLPAPGTGGRALNALIAQGNFRAQLVVADAANNSASALSNFAFMDTIIPTATVTGVSTAVPIITNDPQTINFGGTFNDDPGNGIPFSGLLQMEVQISRRVNGGNSGPFAYLQSFTVAIPQASNASGNWVFNFLPSFPALPVEGFYNLNIRPVDRALNPNGLPSGTGVTAIPNGILFDITGPQLTNFYAQDPNFTTCVGIGEVFIVEYSDISTVSGFDPSDVLITPPGAGTVFNVQPLGNNSFSFQFTAILEDTITLDIADPAVVDQAGNTGGGTASITFGGDVTPPDLECAEAFTVVGADVQFYNPSNPASVFFSALFTEPVTNVTPQNIIVTGPATVASVTPNSGFDNSFLIELTPTGTGVITLAFVDDVIEDCAGNLFDATPYTASVELVPLLTGLPIPAPLVPEQPFRDQLFGGASSLDEGILLVGSTKTETAGVAFVFEVNDDGSTVSQTAILRPFTPVVNDAFGAAVAHSGTWALVGSPYRDTPGNANVGSATFFLRDDNGDYSSSPSFQVFSNTPERESRFGTAVDLNGNYAIIGEPFGRAGGAAEVFFLDTCAGTWAHQQTLVPNDLAFYDTFGFSVATNGVLALVGSYRDDDRGSDTGAVYVFSRSGSNWNQINKIIPGPTVRLDNFGYALDYRAEFLAVTSPGVDFNAIRDRGSLFIFNQPTPTTFAPLAQVQESLTRQSDQFGSSVALNNVGDVIVGARLSDIRGVDSGAAFIYLNNFNYTFGQPFYYLDNIRNNYFGESVAIGQGFGFATAPRASHPDQTEYPFGTGVGLFTSTEIGE